MWGHSGADLEGMSPDTGVALRRRDNSWCLIPKQACHSLRVLQTTTGRVNCAPPRHAPLRPPAPPFAFPRKSGWSLFSSAQLAFASQNLHFEKKTSERDFDV